MINQNLPRLERSCQGITNVVVSEDRGFESYQGMSWQQFWLEASFETWKGQVGLLVHP